MRVCVNIDTDVDRYLSRLVILSTDIHLERTLVDVLRGIYIYHTSSYNYILLYMRVCMCVCSYG